MLILVLLFISCDNNNGIEAQIDLHNPIDITWEKLEEPDIEYNYDWGDSCIRQMDYKDGRWIGLTRCEGRWKEFQPIEFMIVDNKVKKTGYTEPIQNQNYPRIKFNNTTPVILYNEKKDKFFGETDIRIMGDIDFKSKSFINKKNVNRFTNGFAADEFGNIYVPSTPNMKLHLKDRIFLKVSKGLGFKDKLFPKLYKKGLKVKHQEFTIDKYNGNLEKTDSFGRWICWDNITETDSLFRDYLLNIRHIHYYNDHIYTVSTHFGYIEKYDLEGNFASHLDLHSTTPLFNIEERVFNGEISNTKIINGKLFGFLSNSVDKLRDHLEIPQDIEAIHCFIKVDISNENMVLEKVYYYFPQRSDGIKYTSAFVMLDENTLVQSTGKALRVLNLK